MSLYREDYATFGASEVYHHADAEGSIKLFGLPVKVRALVESQEDPVSSSVVSCTLTTND